MPSILNQMPSGKFYAESSTLYAESIIPYAEIFDVWNIDNALCRFVKPEQQTEQLCLKAVRFYGSNLEYIHNKTDGIISLALQDDKHAIRYISKSKTVPVPVPDSSVSDLQKSFDRTLKIGGMVILTGILASAVFCFRRRQ